MQIQHLCGTYVARMAACGSFRLRHAVVGWCCDLGFLVGAGEGNRTLMTSLEGCDSPVSEQRLRRSSAWRRSHE